VDANRFRKLIWAHYKKHGRHSLPWRKTKDPYKILVSEVMLQQTQVERVVPFYKDFLNQFPTVQKLAKAPLSDVLKAWQGLGYNRRAKLLHQAAKAIAIQRLNLRDLGRSDLPIIEELEKLPGVGPYTAGAIAAFAYNQDVIFVETNIRTVITHHFFPNKKEVSDKEIVHILEQVFPKGKAREWYSALMDYGAFLKKSGVKLNSRSKHYNKQSAFNGSLREVRGTILRALATKPEQGLSLLKLLGSARRPQIEEALEDLLKESLIVKKGRSYGLPG
jgi:A/G-specific adenine glycosylase